MKKTLCAVIAATALTLCFTSCSNKAQEGYVVMESESCDFSFEYPKEWTETYKDGMLSVTKMGDATNANIVGFSFSHGLETAPSSLEYWETYKTQLEETFKNVEVSKVKPIKLGSGEHAHAFYTVTIGDEVFEKETLLVVYGNKAYTLTLTQGTKNGEKGEGYEDFSSEFEKCIKSFRIK